MNILEAMKYCENHECSECPVFIKKLDRRTKEETFDVLCCENLVDNKEADKWITEKENTIS